MDSIGQRMNPEPMRSLISKMNSSLDDITNLEKKNYKDASSQELVEVHLKLAKAYMDLPDVQYNKKVLEHCEKALDLLRSEDYPSHLRDEKIREVERIVRPVQSTVKTMELVIRNDVMKTLESIEPEIEKRYNGFWVQRKALLFPLGEAILAVLLLLSILLHEPLLRLLYLPPYQCANGTIVVNGSAALYPLLQKAQGEYASSCSLWHPSISVNPGKLSDGKPLPQGGTDGINQLLQKTPSINIASTDAYADPTLAVKDNQVAVVVFALVVNKNVTYQANKAPVTSLTDQQIAAIYNGDLNNWHDVDSRFNSTVLSVISRPASSQVRQTFEKYILGNTEGVLGPPEALSDVDSDIASKICSSKDGAIGYISLYYYYQHKDCLNVIAIDGKSPLSPESVQPSEANKTPYLFWTLEHMYTSTSPTELAQTFVGFMYSDTVKQYIQRYDKYGYLPISDFPNNVLANH